MLQPQQRLQGGMGPVPERPPVPGLCPGHPPCSDGSSRLRMKAVTAARRRLLRALCARRGVQKRMFQREKQKKKNLEILLLQTKRF